MAEDFDNAPQELETDSTNDPNGWDYSTDKIANRVEVDAEENEQPLIPDEEPESTDSEEYEEEHQEDEQEPEEEVEAADNVKAPIILRKQKKQLTQKVRHLESELAAMRAQVLPRQQPEPQPEIDPNSVEGQVYKTLQGIAEKNRRDSYAQEVERSFNELHQALDETAEKYADFDDVVRGDAPITPAMRDTAMMIPNPGETLYKIAKSWQQDPKAERQFTNLSPKEQAKEMIRISGQLMSNQKSTRRPSTPAKSMTTLRNNPVRRAVPSTEITDKSSVADIRARIKKGWK